MFEAMHGMPPKSPLTFEGGDPLQRSVWDSVSAQASRSVEQEGYQSIGSWGKSTEQIIPRFECQKSKKVSNGFVEVYGPSPRQEALEKQLLETFENRVALETRSQTVFRASIVVSFGCVTV